MFCVFNCTSIWAYNPNAIQEPTGNVAEAQRCTVWQVSQAPPAEMRAHMFCWDLSLASWCSWTECGRTRAYTFAASRYRVHTLRTINLHAHPWYVTYANKSFRAAFRWRVKINENTEPHVNVYKVLNSESSRFAICVLTTIHRENVTIYQFMTARTNDREYRELYNITYE